MYKYIKEGWLTKKTRFSQFVFLIGLALLLVSITLSLDGIFKLEKSINERRITFDIQDQLDDVSKNTKNWYLYQKNKVLNQQIVNDELAQFIKLTDDNLLSIEKKLLQEDVLLGSLQKVKTDWINLKTNSFDSSTAFQVMLRIDNELTFIDKTQSQKLKLNEAVILNDTQNLMSFIFFSALLAMSLIGWSLYYKAQQNKLQEANLKELNRLHKEAESASQLKSKFLSIVSHELRTPLSGIIGVSDLLIDSNRAPSDLKWLKTIQASGRTLLRIINDILDFSKIQSGKFSLELENFDLVATIEQVTSVLAPKAVEKGIALHCDLDATLPKVIKGDADRLTQVLFNLVGNAIKFTHKGSVILKIKVQERLEQNIKILFSVEDTGVGISQADKENIFLPFIQGQNKYISKDPGTGLGLSISYEIVKNMSGLLQFESEANRGTKFWFEFTFSNYSNEAIDVENQNGLSTKSVFLNQIQPMYGDDHFKPKVLIVEDNTTNQMVAQSMLSQLGVDSIIACDGQEALSVFTKGKFDLILMDCQMPIRDGFETSKEIRKIDGLIPIVAATAGGSFQVKQQIYEAGMNDFLIKPYRLIDLESVLKRNLKTQGSVSNYKELKISALEDLKIKIGESATKKVIESFYKGLKSFDSDFQNFLQEKKITELNRLGHKYKSSALVVGAYHFSSVCKQLEEVSHLDQGHEVWKTAKRVVGQLMAEVDLYLGSESK